MTAADFMTQNKDILDGLVTEQDFQEMTDGHVVFILTVSKGSKDILTRPVLSAGYFLTVSSDIDNEGKRIEATVVGLTTGGYAKIDWYNLKDIAGKGHKLIFKCKPLPMNDPRKNYHFTH